MSVVAIAAAAYATAACGTKRGSDDADGAIARTDSNAATAAVALPVVPPVMATAPVDSPPIAAPHRADHVPRSVPVRGRVIGRDSAVVIRKGQPIRTLPTVPSPDASRP